MLTKFVPRRSLAPRSRAARVLAAVAALGSLASSAACGGGAEDASASTSVSDLVVGTVSIRLRTQVTGQYLMAESGGGGALVAASANRGTWETFTARDLTHAALTSGDQVQLATSNGHFVVAEGGGGGAVAADRSSASGWETFVIRKRTGSGAIVDGDEVTLRTVIGGEYVSADQGGGGALTADRAVAQGWETFIVERTDVTTPAPTPAPTPTPAPAPPGSTEYAPYFFTWSWSTSSSDDFASLMNLHDRAGLQGATLAFVLSDGGCATDRGAQDHLSDVKAFVAAGGKLKASFGGAAGDYIENKCGDAASMAKAIEDFVDQTGITDLDFDVEQDRAFTDDVNARRADALKRVQAERGIKVSFTLAAMPSENGDGQGGLTGQGLALLRAVLAKGVAVSHVNLMVMDYGSDWASKKMGAIATSSVTDANRQLKGLLPSLSDAQAWAMLGATPMIGRNDDAETFTLDDARTLAAFAREKKLGLIAFWAINRDRVCADKDSCSTVNTAKLDFHRILSQ